MLGYPKTVIAPFLGPLRQLNSMLEGIGGGLAFRRRALVQDAEFQWVIFHKAMFDRA